MARIFRTLLPLGRRTVFDVSILRGETGKSYLRRVKRFGTAASAAPSSEEKEGVWHVYGSVCLERLPVISAELTDVEQEFQQVLIDIENENSMLSDHELRHLADKRLAEMRKREDYEETETDAVRVTALEDEDKWHQELKTISPASRITEADKADDKKSTDRKLDKKLVFVVHQKMGDDKAWVLPQVLRVQNENLRQTAERALRSSCGVNLKATFLGNAPCGFYQYKYPQAVRDETGVQGGKVFFFKAVTKGGPVEKQSSILDYLWISKDEMPQYMKAKYFREIDKFILDL